MKVETIAFQKNAPLKIEIFSIKKLPIQWHEGVTEIVMPLNGSIIVETDFEKNIVDEGEFWFINNKSVHSIQSISDVIVASFYIDLDYCKDRFEYIEYMFFRSNAYNEDKTVDLDKNRDQDYIIRFRNMLLSILTEYQKDAKLPVEVRERLFNKLVYAMVYEFNWLQFIERKESFISSVHLDRYHRIMKYVDENYHKKITLDDIISMEYITKTYFSHFWKKLSSFSFQERINYERTLKSTKMLFSNMTITEISERCGFSDTKYYYKHFKRWYRCMPLEYRHKCKVYGEEGFEFEELDFINVNSVLKDYLKEYFELYYNKDVDSEATDIVNHYANIRYLHLLNQAGDSNVPKFTNINILGGYCFCLTDQSFEFNWHNIDVLINMALDIDFVPNILISNHEISEEILLKALRKFLYRCIEYYGKAEVRRWKYSIDYSNLIKSKDIDQIYKELNSRIKDLDINYFFEY